MALATCHCVSRNALNTVHCDYSAGPVTITDAFLILTGDGDHRSLLTKDRICDVIRAMSMQDIGARVDELTLEEEREPVPQVSDVETEQRRILTQPSDPTIKDLWDRWKEGDLLVQPEFQRYHVWDSVKSSRLIESVVLDVPLPIVYLAEEPDGRESVVDGQQRLTAFFDFLDSSLALKGLEARPDLNGKRFSQLDKLLQNKIRRFSIRVITIRKESDKDLKFEIFERLNTGAVPLNDQELRNCIYRGPYNKLLRELASDSDFMFLLGISQPERRMRDIELVLRFAAFYHSTYLRYAPPMRRFLNDDMDRFQEISSKDETELRRVFKTSVQTVRSLLGHNAFKRFYRGESETRPDGYWEPKKFNASLYDILMYGFTVYDRNQLYPHLDSIREALIWLMTEDQNFVDAIELSTSSLKMVTRRFDKWRKALGEVVGSPRTEPRCFTRSLKEKLYDFDSTCRICGQRISDIDDSSVDHIEQYWLGGKTIPDNARLTHRFCNLSRPRMETTRDG